MKKRILYVEDNLNNMLLVKRIIQSEGHAMLEAVDGETGWTVAKREQPDLILMDLRLPGQIDGFELTRRIKADPQLNHIPVIVLTAHGDAAAQREAETIGCEGFLHKPADIRQVQAVLRQYLGTPALPLLSARPF
ncbi:MAG TPA: response regulator [Anaerolineae bacterium]|jgi:two-component system cell cycle response regulator DivK